MGRADMKIVPEALGALFGLNIEHISLRRGLDGRQVIVLHCADARIPKDVHRIEGTFRRNPNGSLFVSWRPEGQEVATATVAPVGFGQ